MLPVMNLKDKGAAEMHLGTNHIFPFFVFVRAVWFTGVAFAV